MNSNSEDPKVWSKSFNYSKSSTPVWSVEDLLQQNYFDCLELTSNVSLLLSQKAPEALHKAILKPETDLNINEIKEKFYISGWTLPPEVGSSMVLLRSGFLLDFKPLNLNSDYFSRSYKIPESWFDLALEKGINFCEKNGPKALEAVFIDRLVKFYVPFM